MEVNSMPMESLQQLEEKAGYEHWISSASRTGSSARSDEASLDEGRMALDGADASDMSEEVDDSFDQTEDTWSPLLKRDSPEEFNGDRRRNFSRKTPEPVVDGSAFRRFGSERHDRRRVSVDAFVDRGRDEQRSDRSDRIQPAESRMSARFSRRQQAPISGRTSKEGRYSFSSRGRKDSLRDSSYTPWFRAGESQFGDGSGDEADEGTPPDSPEVDTNSGRTLAGGARPSEMLSLDGESDFVSPWFADKERQDKSGVMAFHESIRPGVVGNTPRTSARVTTQKGVEFPPRQESRLATIFQGVGARQSVRTSQSTKPSSRDSSRQPDLVPSTPKGKDSKRESSGRGVRGALSRVLGGRSSRGSEASTKGSTHGSTSSKRGSRLTSIVMRGSMKKDTMDELVESTYDSDEDAAVPSRGRMETIMEDDDETFTCNPMKPTKSRKGSNSPGTSVPFKDIDMRVIEKAESAASKSARKAVERTKSAKSLLKRSLKDLKQNKDLLSEIAREHAINKKAVAAPPSAAEGLLLNEMETRATHRAERKTRIVYDDGEPVPEDMFSDSDSSVEVLDLEECVLDDNVSRALRMVDSQ